MPTEQGSAGNIIAVVGNSDKDRFSISALKSVLDK